MIQFIPDAVSRPRPSCVPFRQCESAHSRKFIDTNGNEGAISPVRLAVRYEFRFHRVALTRGLLIRLMPDRITRVSRYRAFLVT